MRGVVLFLVLVAVAVVAPAFARAAPLVADGVTIQGVPVGGMTESEATTALQDFARRPFAFTFRTRAWNATAYQVGSRADIAGAVTAALAAPADAALPLGVTIDLEQLTYYVAKLDADLSRPARNSTVFLRDLRPRITKARKGFDVDRFATKVLVKQAIKAFARGPIAVVYRTVAPSLTLSNFGPVVVIRRDSHRLFLYNGMQYWARFGVAVGRPEFPTPIGKFRIVTMQRNPWWIPPDSAWAAGASPIPPGPGNPLGTRWMGLSASGVGMHGTPDAASIGYSASHGCIRMRIADAEWLFNRVRVGTTVFIVRA
ncbi:MAG: L,D-transpeptidase family protein [Gaiellaceae bacterium]